MLSAKGGARLVPLAALLLLSALRAYSADQAPAVLQVLAPAGGTADRELEEVIGEFLAIEVERAGLRALRPRAAGRDLFTAAAALDATYVLSGVYTRTGQTVEIVLQWHDVAERRLIAETRGRGRLDLQLDAVLVLAVGELLDAAGARQPRRDDPDPASSVTAAAGVAGPVMPGGPAPEETPVKHWMTAVSAAPFLVSGDASDYLKLGVMPGLFAGRRVRAGEGVLAFGLHAGYGWFLTEGELESARIQVLPAGAEVRYEAAGASPFAFYLRAAAGPAVLSLDSGDGWRRKTTIFVSAGIGVVFALTPTYGFSLDTSYTLVSEAAFPLGGFTPALSTYMRF